MKRIWIGKVDALKCRAPYGARGLKRVEDFRLVDFGCRAPYGARGLKLLGACYQAKVRRRAPYGARGLKREKMLDTCI